MDSIHLLLHLCQQRDIPSPVVFCFTTREPVTNITVKHALLSLSGLDNFIHEFDTDSTFLELIQSASEELIRMHFD